MSSVKCTNAPVDILAIIPARGGSKTVPGKNIRLLHNKPLLGYTIEAARQSKYLNRIAVSTDHDEIAAVARQYHAEVIHRPAELSSDTAAMMPAIIHAVDVITSGQWQPRVVVVLQPTSPFRKPDDIDTAIDRILSGQADIVACLTPAHKHPFWMKVIDHGYVAPFINAINPAIRRQDLPPAFAMNGSIYAISYSSLEARRDIAASFATQLPGEKVGALILKDREALEIDTEFEFSIAAALMQTC